MPEKTVNEIPRPTRELYERGQAALQRQNWDYAITIFTQVLQSEPAFYECREALRAAQLRKAEGRTGFFKKFLGSASSSPLFAKGQYLLRNNPVEAVSLCEQILNTDPNNVGAHKLLAEAAFAADMPKTAVLSLEIAFRNAPKDRDVAMRLGEALTRAGQIARAEMVYSELQKAFPNDMAIAQALKNVSAKRTMTEGGYDAIAEGTGSYRDILRDEAEAVILEQEGRHYKSGEAIDRLIADYTERIAKDPNNLKLLRSMAELHASKGDYDQALHFFNEIVAREGGSDPSLDRAISEITVKKFDRLIAELDPQQPNYEQDLARLNAERAQFQLGAAKRRAERYPNDLQVRFELGRLYFEAGQIGEAIQEFQKAQANPHRRIPAMLYLGQCFAKRGMNDLAARTFQNAIKEKVVFDDEKKELIYWLGSVLQAQGKADEAIEQFKQIYEIDIGYKDVAAKVDAYYTNR